MQFFRSHIARVYGLTLLLLGITLSQLHTDQQKHDHSAFTAWLEGHLRTADENIQQQLDSIANDEGDFEAVIRRASVVVKTNSDEFDLPVSTEPDENGDQVYQLLLTQWNDYRDAGSAMGNAVRVEPVKTHLVLPIDAPHLASTVAKKQSIPKTPISFSHLEETGTLAPSYILSPFESGTAIGAP